MEEEKKDVEVTEATETEEFVESVGDTEDVYNEEESEVE